MHFPGALLLGTILILLRISDASAKTAELRYVRVMFISGEPTNSSLEQMRLLGRWIRNRYHELLHPAEHHEGRVIDAKAFESVDIEPVRWLIKELDFERKVDVDVKEEPRNCRRFKEELERVRTQPAVQKSIAMYDGLYSYVRSNIGMEMGGLTPDEYIYRVRDQLDLSYELRPKWCTSGVFGLFNEVVSLHHDIESYSPVLKRINCADFLDSFLEFGRGSARVTVQAGNDGHVAALVRALRRRTPSLSKPGNAVALEKWIDGTEERVHVVARMKDFDFEVPLKGCYGWCTVDEFKDLVSDALGSEDNLCD